MQKQTHQMWSGRFHEPLTRTFGQWQRSALRGAFGCSWVFGWLLFTINARAQQSPPIDVVLAHLRSSIAASVTALPSFTCTEQILSQETRNNHVTEETRLATDLRVTRSATSDPQTGTRLKEIRVLRTVEGKPPAGQNPSLPLTVYGVFGDGFDRFLDSKFAPCLSAELGIEERLYGHPTMAVHFLPKPDDNVTGKPCPPVAPGASATLWLDPQSYNLVAAETNIPHAKVLHYQGLRVSYRYAPVMLNNQQFILPQSVDATMTDLRSSGTLRYQATYTECHLYSVSTTIQTSPNTGSQQSTSSPH